MSWATIEAIMVCVSNIVPTLKKEDIPIVSDVVRLVFELPSKYLALTRTGVNLLSHIS
jgi:hypothetical protein